MSKLKPYDSYQLVEYDYVSKLPEGWQLLPNIAIFQERIERGFTDEELLSVTIGRGVIKQSELDKKDSSTLDKSKYLLVYPDDLVYSMRFRQGASGYSIFKGIVSPACTVLKPKKGIGINPKFFYYVFRTGFFKNYVERFAYGIADGQIPLRYVDFKRMYSIVPPLETQNAIVAYLDLKTQKIQEFIINKERFINILKERLNTIKFDLVTNGINTVTFIDVDLGWLQRVPSEWNLLKLKYCIKNITSGITPSMDNPSFWNGTVPWVSPKDMKLNTVYDSILHITDKALINTAIKLVPVNSILIVVRSGILQRTLPTSINSKEVTINQDLKAITVNERLLIPQYFQLLLQGLENCILYECRKAIATVESIEIPDLKNFVIPFPSLKEQREILDGFNGRLNKISRSIKSASIEIEKAIEYQESLITQVVTGQLKVPCNPDVTKRQNINTKPLTINT